jgi:hypothetical protein
MAYCGEREAKMHETLRGQYDIELVTLSIAGYDEI